MSNKVQESDIVAFVKQMFPPSSHKGEKRSIMFGLDTIKSIHKETGDDKFLELVTSMNIIGDYRTIDYIIEFKKKYIMTHKEEMEYLKQHDPILYYELTSDPTHGINDLGIGGLLAIVLAIGSIIGLIIYLI